MRIAICAMLLTCFLSGSMSASEISIAQAQLLVNAAQKAKPNGEAEKITLSIEGKEVVFTVTRDAVGNVIARPVPGGDGKGISVNQVSIQMRADDKGNMQPKSIVVISDMNTITGYQIQLNTDGSLAKLFSGTGGTGGSGGIGAGQGETVVVGGINGSDTSGAVVNKTEVNKTAVINQTTWSFPATLTWVQGSTILPAGAGTGDVSGAKK